MVAGIVVLVLPSQVPDQGIVRSQDSTGRSWFKVSRFCYMLTKHSCDRRLLFSLSNTITSYCDRYPEGRTLKVALRSRIRTVDPNRSQVKSSSAGHVLFASATLCQTVGLAPAPDRWLAYVPGRNPTSSRSAPLCSRRRSSRLMRRGRSSLSSSRKPSSLTCRSARTPKSSHRHRLRATRSELQGADA